MDIPTINKMLLLNKNFYEIYSNDIVWNNIFHKNFTRLRIIERPETEKKKISEKNQLGKKRKRFISAIKGAKNISLEKYTPKVEDSYNIIIAGLLEYMPIENAIRDIYGENQDIFCFFNCFFFYDETISLLCSYYNPNLLVPYTIASTD
jgi:hypothetical protein